MLRHTQVSSTLRAMAASSNPLSRMVLRYRSMRRRVVSLLWMFMRNGRPARAMSSVDSSPEHARMMAGWGFVYGRGRRSGSLQVPELPLVLVVRGRPRLDHDLFGLDQAVVRLLRIDAVALVLVDVERRAAPEPDHDPASADVVDQGHLLGEADRVVQGHLGDGEADVDLLRAGGKRGGEGDGIDVGADAVEVVLGEPEHVHAEVIAQLRFVQRLLDDPLIVRRVHRAREQEVAESHEILSSSRSSAEEWSRGGSSA